MPLFLNHRINSLKELNKVHLKEGIEIDVRDYKNKIVLSHDPFNNGELFDKFLKKIKNRMTILNVKSFGLINLILKKTKKKNNFFFLDLCFSEIDKMIKLGFSNKIVLRFSKYEKFDLKNKSFKNIKWIWYDYFDEKIISKSDYLYIKRNKKKICIVSPDLLGAKKEKVLKFIKYLNKNKFKIEAICTKNNFIKYWKENYIF